MFNYDVYANTIREFLAVKKIGSIHGKAVSDLSDLSILGMFGWLTRQNDLEKEYEAFETSRLGGRTQRQRLSIDIEKTGRYYASEKADEYCNCPYCINYRARIATAFPDAAAYMQTLGIDIAKPFNVSYLEPENGLLKYINCCYVAFGDGDLAWRKEIGDVEIIPQLYYPDPGVEEPFIVIGFAQINLPYIEGAIPV